MKGKKKIDLTSVYMYNPHTMLELVANQDIPYFHDGKIRRSNISILKCKIFIKF